MGTLPLIGQRAASFCTASAHSWDKTVMAGVITAIIATQETVGGPFGKPRCVGWGDAQDIMPHLLVPTGKLMGMDLGTYTNVSHGPVLLSGEHCQTWGHQEGGEAGSRGPRTTLKTRLFPATVPSTPPLSMLGLALPNKHAVQLSSWQARNWVTATGW